MESILLAQADISGEGYIVRPMGRIVLFDLYFDHLLKIYACL